MYFAPCSTASSLGSMGSSLPATLSQSDVVGVTSFTSAVSAIPDRPSPELLATLVQAIKQALAAEQAPVLQANFWDFWFCFSCSLAGVSGRALGSQASALLTAGSSFPSQLSEAQLPSSSGRPAFVVPSFASTFASLISSLGSSRANSSLAVTS